MEACSRESNAHCLWATYWEILSKNHMQCHAVPPCSHESCCRKTAFEAPEKTCCRHKWQWHCRWPVTVPPSLTTSWSWPQTIPICMFHNSGCDKWAVDGVSSKTSTGGHWLGFENSTASRRRRSSAGNSRYRGGLCTQAAWFLFAVDS